MPLTGILVGLVLLAGPPAPPPTPSPAVAAPAGVEIAFDFEAAQATLDALSGAPGAGYAAIARLPGNARLIEHQARFDPVATADRFAESLRDASRPGSTPAADPFVFTRVRERLAATRVLLARVKADPSALAAELRRRIGKYTPPDLAIPVTVYFVAGGTSDGFSDGRVFCVALDYFRDDFAGLRTLMAHELFHVAYDSLERPKPSGPPAAERILTLLDDTRNEGVASRVGDPLDVADGKAWIEWFQGKFRKNLDRMDANFALFDLILYREYHDPGAPTDNLYRIGFTGSFDSALYFVGYEMARVLEQEQGAGAVAACLSQSPLRFFEGYVALAKAHPERVKYRFDASTEEILRAISASAKAPNP